MANEKNDGMEKTEEVMNNAWQYVKAFLTAVGKGLKVLGRAFAAFIKRYFKIESEKRTISQSIELIAKVVYWFHLIVGFLGALGFWGGSLVYIVDGFSYYDFPENLIMLALLIGGGFVSMLLSKFIGWMSTIFLRAFAVVVASHEKHLREDDAAAMQPLTEASAAEEAAEPTAE